MNYLLCDLDDTLFQSRRKTESPDNCYPIAHSPDGTPNGFMTTKQVEAFAMLSQAMTLIPVTARDLNAFSRVSLPSTPYAVIDHGGVILDERGEPLPSWLSHMQQITRASMPWLTALRSDALRFIESEGLNASSRLISDLGMTFYWLSKYQDGSAEDLNRLENAFVRPWLAAHSNVGLVHRNGNNLAVLPNGLQKRRAVAHLLDLLRKTDPTMLAWGMGDSYTDIPFMLECDYVISPRNSQISGALRAWLT